FSCWALSFLHAKTANGISFFLSYSAFSLRALREQLLSHAKGAKFLSRKDRKGYFLLLCVLCVFFACSASTYFFHAKGAKVFSFLFFAISGLRFFTDKDIGYVKLSTSFNDCDTQLKLLYHHQFTFHAYPRYH